MYFYINNNTNFNLQKLHFIKTYIYVFYLNSLIIFQNFVYTFLVNNLYIFDRNFI